MHGERRLQLVQSVRLLTQLNYRLQQNRRRGLRLSWIFGRCLHGEIWMKSLASYVDP